MKLLESRSGPRVSRPRTAPSCYAYTQPRPISIYLTSGQAGLGQVWRESPRLACNVWTRIVTPHNSWADRG